MVQNTRKKKEQQTIEKRPSPPRLVARSRSDGRARDDGKASGGSVRSGGSGGRAGGRAPAPAASTGASCTWEACPFSTEGGTRRVQLVREEGRDVSC